MKLKLFEKNPEEIMFAQAQAQTNMCVYQTCLKINTLFTTDINSCNYGLVVYYSTRLVNIAFK